MSVIDKSRESSLPEKPVLFDGNGKPLDEQGREIKMGIDWGSKPAPQGPPAEVERPVSEWFKPILKHLKGVVADEGLVIDLCLERAVEIVKWNHLSKMYGSDFFAGGPDGTGANIDRLGLISLAIPLAGKLYDGVTAVLNTPEQKALLEKMVADAKPKA